eukprot:1195949-Prorocentrum_minimum.AAC.2
MTDLLLLGRCWCCHKSGRAASRGAVHAQQYPHAEQAGVGGVPQPGAHGVGAELAGHGGALWEQHRVDRDGGAGHVQQGEREDPLDNLYDKDSRRAM